jgi:hypothetical protein
MDRIMSAELRHIKAENGYCANLPDWGKEFNVHVDASSIALGVFLS